MGAPVGNQNARKRHWSNAVEAAVMVEDKATQRKRLFNIADRLVAMAESGDMQAIKELGDRLDGKPAQAIDLTANVTNRAALLSDDDLAEVANAGNRNPA